MSLKKRIKVFHKVTLRIALLYAMSFALMSLLTFEIGQIIISKNLYSRMDEELVEDVTELEKIYSKEGLEGLKRQFKIESEADGISKVFFRIFSEDFMTLASSDLSQWGGANFNKQYLIDIPPGKFRLDKYDVPQSLSEARIVTKKLQDGKVLQIGNVLLEENALLSQYRDITLFTIILMTLVGGGVGWLISKKAMSGVARITQTAKLISTGNLNLRVPLGNEGEEIEALAEEFNNMIEQIVNLLKELKEVTNDIAHDLRSPITRIRGNAEAIVTDEQGVGNYREFAGLVVEESDRLIGMINTMLEIAETDAGLIRTKKEKIELNQIAKDAYELFLPVAEDKKISLKLIEESHDNYIEGDKSRLQRAVANLLDNAINYTAEEGNISMRIFRDNDNIILTVSDTGIGISEQDLPRIFDKFFRADKSRSTAGNGLGLSLVKSIIQAHSGTISAKSTPGEGSKFTLRLPLISN